MDIDYRALSPELILSGTILIVLVVDVFLSARRKWLAMPISLVGVVAALAALLSMIGRAHAHGVRRQLSWSTTSPCSSRGSS